jgi:hypothetical protein
MNDSTSSLTTAEIAKYLAEQQSKGWPGSVSIKNRPVSRSGKNA